MSCMDARNRSMPSVLCRDGFMPRKFFTIVECDGVAFALVWSQQTRYYSRYTIGMAARDMPRSSCPLA